MSVRGTHPVQGSLRDWIAYAERRFSAARLAFGHGTHNARDEAVWLMVHVLGIDFAQVALLAAQVLDEREERSALHLVERRITSRRPLAYLLREAWLAGERFYVDERVIVPRSFIAELLPQGLSAWLRPGRTKHVLDLCTGSGCLAVLAARAFPGARVVASDLSAAALAVARRNVAQHRLLQRIGLVQSNLFARVPRRPFELILCNPPYVNDTSMRALPREYRAEPKRALAGGRDGLDAVMSILQAAPEFLAPAGVLVMEIGHNRRTLERRATGVPFTWLRTSAGDGLVFLVTREELLSASAGSGAAPPSRSRRASRRGSSQRPR